MNHRRAQRGHRPGLEDLEGRRLLTAAHHPAHFRPAAALHAGATAGAGHSRPASIEVRLNHQLQSLWQHQSQQVSQAFQAQLAADRRLWAKLEHL